MKKGFTMIELIFVIVILGILASVAIPRLASTRTDAEISATVANIRTLISDAASYYAVKGEFGSTAKWSDITNVSVRKGDRTPASDSSVADDVYLTTGDINCILVRLRDKGDPGRPVAFIQIAKVLDNVNTGICPDIINAAPIRAYLDAQVQGVTPEGSDTGIRPGVIPVSSSISIHE